MTRSLDELVHFAADAKKSGNRLGENPFAPFYAG
jgi:hypothetical protein